MPLSLNLRLDAGAQVDLRTHAAELNPIHGAMLYTLVHESLHLALDANLRSFLGAKLNEDCIVALTSSVVAVIHRRPRLEAWWMARCATLLPPASQKAT